MRTATAARRRCSEGASGSERDPNAIAPVAAAFMVAAPMTIAVIVPIAVEIPAVRMELDVDARTIVISVVGVPAIAFGVADDVGRRTARRNREGGRAQQRGPCQLGYRFHIDTPICCPAENALDRSGVPLACLNARQCDGTCSPMVRLELRARGWMEPIRARFVFRERLR